MRYAVLTDDDVRRMLPMSAGVDRIASALREHAEGTLVAPSRFRVNVAKGAGTAPPRPSTGSACQGHH